MLKSLFVSALVATAAIACAKGGATPAPAASSGNPMMDAATKALADKIGVNQQYVQLAATTAQSMLASGSDEQTAIAGGVDKAAAQASADGKPMTAEQKSGLLDGLKSVIGL